MTLYYLTRNGDARGHFDAARKATRNPDHTGDVVDALAARLQRMYRRAPVGLEFSVDGVTFGVYADDADAAT